MQLALTDATLGPADISAVIGTSNGSPVLDRLEAAAIADVFDRRRSGRVDEGRRRGVGRGRSGGRHRRAVVYRLGRAHARRPVCATPTIGCSIRVSRGAQPVDGDTFLVNSVASGGTNYSVVVRVRRPS